MTVSFLIRRGLDSVRDHYIRRKEEVLGLPPDQHDSPPPWRPAYRKEYSHSWDQRSKEGGGEDLHWESWYF